MVDEQRRSTGGYRLGVAVDRGHVATALVDANGAVTAVAAHRLESNPSPRAVWDELVAQVSTYGLDMRDIDRVMFAVSQVDGAAALPDPDVPEWWPWLRHLRPVGVVRLGAATTAVPPLALWPSAVRRRVSLAEVCVAGGAMLDGSDFEPLDEEGLVAFARDVAGRVAAVAVSGVFSTVTPRHEVAAAAILGDELGASVPIVLSHECGGLGLVERENATVLQAALTEPAQRGAARLQGLLADCGLGHVEVFFARADGTVMAVDYAATHPLQMYGGMDAATVRGTARLTGDTDALVALADPSGAARAISAVTAGFPRLTTGPTRIAGVPTSLRVLALVPAGPPSWGDGAAGPPVDVHAVTDAIDRAKDAPGDLPLLLGGPGAEALAAALPARLDGTVHVRCPSGAQAAAAVGVATAPVIGEAARIMTLSGANTSDGQQVVCSAARSVAVRTGADPRRVAVTVVEESPLAYLTDPAVVVWARAEGPPRSGGSEGVVNGSDGLAAAGGVSGDDLRPPWPAGAAPNGKGRGLGDAGC